MRLQELLNAKTLETDEVNFFFYRHFLVENQI